jgi:hypothetical protein
VNASDFCKSRFELTDRLAEREITSRDHLPQPREDGFRVSELLGQV